jgi:iron complex transport system substrate-binding protein
MTLKLASARAGVLALAVSAAAGVVAGAAGDSMAATRSSNGITIQGIPHRIVSMSPAATEDLYAVGAGKQVVAVDRYSIFPKGAPRTKLSGYTPNVEAIAKYKPDLVVITDNVNHLTTQFAALHVPVLVEPAPSNLTGAYAQISQIGVATGHSQKARSVIANMRSRIAAIVASVKKQHPALTVYDELDQTYYSATSKTFIGQVYAKFGLRNIADGAANKVGAYPQLSSEYIVGADPDLVVLADTTCCGQSAATVAKRPGWSTITAVKHDYVLAVNDTIASEWGPQIVTFFSEVAGEIRKIEAGGA